MKLSVKAFLFSAGIFPGAGHFLLKRYVTACALTGFTLYALFNITSIIFSKTTLITQKVLSGEVSPDTDAVLAMLEKHASITEANDLNTAMSIIVAAWIIGMLDAYRVGIKKERDRKLSETAKKT